MTRRANGAASGRHPRRRGRRLLLGVVGAVVAALAPTIWVRAAAAPHEFDEAGVPATPVAVVLGASVQPNGQPSRYLAARLEVARRLFAAGRVRAILVSGDNGSRGYDEPTAMKRWLVEHGVPEGKVVADFAGFDTYDSCVRAKAVFGARQVVMVTQSYHLYRAVATCRAIGLDAVGVGDDTVRAQSASTWRHGQIRELGAAWKMVWDVLSRRQPTLGPRETSLDDALR